MKKFILYFVPNWLLVLYWNFNPRSIHQLLKVMEDNDDLFNTGLCEWASVLEDYDKISVKEWYLLHSYIKANKPSNTANLFWWPRGIIRYRLSWLEHHIELTGDGVKKSIIELLNELSKSTTLAHGLCASVDQLYVDSKINNTELKLLFSYIEMYTPENLTNRYGYWWKHGDSQSRLDWINLHIKLNNEKSKIH